MIYDTIKLIFVYSNNNEIIENDYIISNAIKSQGVLHLYLPKRHLSTLFNNVVNLRLIKSRLFKLRRDLFKQTIIQEKEDKFS